MIFVKVSRRVDLIDINIFANGVVTAYGNANNSVISKIIEAHGSGRVL